MFLRNLLKVYQVRDFVLYFNFFITIIIFLYRNPLGIEGVKVEYKKIHKKIHDFLKFQQLKSTHVCFITFIDGC